MFQVKALCPEVSRQVWVAGKVHVLNTSEYKRDHMTKINHSDRFCQNKHKQRLWNYIAEYLNIESTVKIKRKSEKYMKYIHTCEVHARRVQLLTVIYIVCKGLCQRLGNPHLHCIDK